MAKAGLARKSSVVCCAVLFSCLLSTARAKAEIKIGEADGWEVYSSGQVNTFLSYTFGTGYPVPPVDPVTKQDLFPAVVPGGGVGETGPRIPDVDAAGNPIPGRQGSIRQWRVRNGFSPNVLGLGLRKQVTPNLKLRAQFSIWGTIEPPGQQKYRFVTADFREGFGEASGDWGALTIGRHLGLFSRGIVEMDFLYAHQFGMGYPGGNVAGNGPTAGLIGFGVLAAFFSPGIMYTTPKLSGFQLNVGVYDGVQIAGSWESTRTPRPEFELTYDYKSEGFFAKAFVNGAYQKLYLLGDNGDETAVGAGYGARVEFGPFHLGAGGHYGKGLGLFYALEGGRTSAGPITPGLGRQIFELRTFDGLSVFAQYAPGKFDINLALGQSRVHLLPQDENGPDSAADSVIKTQTGIAAGFVYHLSDRFHWDIDYMRAMFRWYKGEKQDVNFVNTGVTLQW